MMIVLELTTHDASRSPIALSQCKGHNLTHSPTQRFPFPPMPTAEAVVAMLLDMGNMAVSTGSMMAPEAVMATVSFITVSDEGTIYVILSREENFYNRYIFMTASEAAALSSSMKALMKAFLAST